MNITLNELVHKWTKLRQSWQARQYAPNEGQVRQFVDETNGLSSQLIAEMGSRDPDFYAALSEMAGNAVAVLRLNEGGVSGG